MTYTLTSYDGSKTFLVTDQNIDILQAPLALVGRGAVGYGQSTAQNFIHMLENFAAPNHAALDALKPMTGQIWFDETAVKLRVNTGTPSAPVWDLVGKPTSGASAPSSPNIGDLWYDTVNGLLKVWNGSAFVTVNTPAANTIAPSSPTTGTIWYDTTNNVLKIYNGTLFTAVGPLAISLTGDATGTGVINNTTGATPIAVTLATQGGLSAGTYNSVTINTKGLVTAASNIGGSTPFLLTNGSSGPTTDNSFSIGDNTHRYANIYAVTFQGQATSALYADLAERYASDEPLEPGDVVSLGGSAEIYKAKGYMSPEVFGVVSTNPAFRMNEAAGNDETHPFVALSGRVPCKVVGMVRKGQRLVVSTLPGIAVAATLGEVVPVYVIGRAVGEKTDLGVGVVEIVVGVK